MEKERIAQKELAAAVNDLENTLDQLETKKRKLKQQLLHLDEQIKLAKESKDIAEANHIRAYE